MAEPQILEGFDRRYSAFISYRHMPLDRQWAKWVLDTLESYRTPADLVKRGFAARLGQMYRDEDENPASAELGDQIEKALAAADTLIVIASSHTQASQWIDREVRLFQEMGKGDRILVLLVEGEPATSYPKALLEGGKEPIAADVRPRPDEPAKLLKTRAKLRLASALLGCAYDDLAKRDQQRERRRRWLIWGGGTLAATLALTLFVRNAQENERIRLERIALTISQDNRLSERDKAFTMFSALSPSGWPFITLPPKVRDLLMAPANQMAIEVVTAEGDRGITSVYPLNNGDFLFGTANGKVFRRAGNQLVQLMALPACSDSGDYASPCAVTALAIVDGKPVAGHADGQIRMGRASNPPLSLPAFAHGIAFIQPVAPSAAIIADATGKLARLDGGRITQLPDTGRAVAGIAPLPNQGFAVGRTDGQIERWPATGPATIVARYGPVLRAFDVHAGQMLAIKSAVPQAFDWESLEAHLLSGPLDKAMNKGSDAPSQALDRPEMSGLAFLGDSPLFIYGHSRNLYIGDSRSGLLAPMQLTARDPFRNTTPEFLFHSSQPIVTSADGRFVISLEPEALGLISVDLQSLRSMQERLSRSRNFRYSICADQLAEAFASSSGQEPVCP